MADIIKRYDPVGPIRDPRSRRTTRDATRDMARVMVQLHAASFDGTVYQHDLHKAGFSNGEIDACRGNAAAMAREMMRPRQVSAAELENAA